MSQGNQRRNKPRAANSGSLLLDNSENEHLQGMLGKGCVSLATGVVQLYTADPPARTRWTKRFCGVACFIKDNPNRSYFIRVYDIKKSQMIWEQEIYNQFRYKAPREYFHTFEAEDVQAGLNFASEDEAFKFKNAVEQKLMERHQRRLDKKKNQQGSINNNRNQNQGGVSSPPPSINNSNPPLSTVDVNLNKTSGKETISKGNKGKSKEKDKKKKLTKEDISTPTDFRHVSHVGWDPDKGFDMNNLDTGMKELFESVGIDENEVVDKETVDFIYDFVEQHGGIDAVKAEMASRPPPMAPSAAPPAVPPQRTASRAPPPPSRPGPAAPPPPSRAHQAPPPPPPNRGPRNLGAPPPPPPQNAPNTGFQPPPPPVKPSMGPPPPPPSTGFSPPQPSSGGPPPPPPPPPPPMAPAAPPPPPLTGGGQGVPTPPIGGGDIARNALMDQIHKGKSLKTVTAEERPAAAPDARGDLLSAIRSGKNLKHVDPTDEKSAPQQEASGGIVGALARALANRQKHIQGSDDEDDDDEDDVDDDDDWDD